MTDIPKPVTEALAHSDPSGCPLKSFMANLPIEERFAVLKKLSDDNANLQMHSDAAVPAGQTYAPTMYQSHTDWHLSLDFVPKTGWGGLFDRKQVYSETIDLNTLNTEVQAQDSKGAWCN